LKKLFPPPLEAKKMLQKVHQVASDHQEEMDSGLEKSDSGEEKCRDFFLKGRCWRGDKCKFAHGDMCIDFSNGRCHRSDCKFAHVGSSSEYGPLPSALLSAVDHPGDEREKCLDFSKGKCFRGQSCRFSHDWGSAPPKPFSFANAASSLLFNTSPELPGLFNSVAEKTADVPVCRDYQNGRCTRANCKFSHGSPPISFQRSPPPFSTGLPPCSLGPASAHHLATLATALSAAPSAMSALPALTLEQTALQNASLLLQSLQSPALHPSFFADTLMGQALTRNAERSRATHGLPLLWTSAPPPFSASPGPAFDLPGAASSQERILCRDFQKGKCTRGENCRFSHEAPPQQPAKEMEICRDHLKGQCTRGDSCKFLHYLHHGHGQSLNSAIPDKLGLLDVMKQNLLGVGGSMTRRRSSEPCRDFLNGNCNRGTGCKFSHDLRLRDSEPSGRFRPY